MEPKEQRKVDEFIVFENSELGLLGSRGNDQFLVHRRSPMAEAASRTGTRQDTSHPNSGHELSWKLLYIEELSGKSIPALNSSPQHCGKNTKFGDPGRTYSDPPRVLGPGKTPTTHACRAL